MGFAKYFEDDIEIMIERQYLQEIHTADFFCSTRIRVAAKEKEDAGKRKQANYEDKYIECKDCGKKFLFTAKKQKEYIEKGWSMPKRCKSCRDYRNIRYLMHASH